MAIVTGAGTGIGAASARALTQAGYRVVATGRRRHPIERIAAEIGAVALPGDVGSEPHVERLVAQTIERFGQLDAVVLNAGIVIEGSVAELDPHAWEATMRTNLTGAFLVTRAALPHLLEGTGSIVTIASVGAIRSAPKEAAYATSKAALAMFTHTLALDHGTRGLRANAVCPGWTRTEMADQSMDELGRRAGVSRERAYELATAAVPQRRAASPAEVASVVRWLLSAAARGVNGAMITVDGGINALDAGTVAWALG